MRSLAAHSLWFYYIKPKSSKSCKDLKSIELTFYKNLFSYEDAKQYLTQMSKRVKALSKDQPLLDDQSFKLGKTDWDHRMNKKGHLALGTTHTEGLVVGLPNKIHTTVTSYRKIFEKGGLQNNTNFAISLVKR